MIYNPYTYSDKSINYNPYQANNNINTGYNVPTYNVNNTIG